MTDLKTGILLWSQAATWPEMHRRGDAGRSARLRPPLDVGPPVRDLRRPVPADLRGLDARSPPGRSRPSGRGSVCSSAPTRSATRASSAKSTTTLDHVSGGRAILGIGGAWMELEHQAHGIDFGSGFGQRLDWLDESVAAIRARPRRRTVTSTPDGRYAFDDLVQQPAAGPAAPPDHDRRQRREEDAADRREVRRHVERDGPARRHGATRSRSSRRHCDAVGRDIAEIEFTLGVKFTIRDSKAEADRVWRGGDGAQPDADVGRRGRRHVLERLAGGAGRQAAALRRARLPDGHLGAAGAVRRRDARALRRRGEAAHRRAAEA